MPRDMEAVKETLRRRLGLLNGKNKISELERLLFEIARREFKPAGKILEETLRETGLDKKERWPFAQLKKALLRRRFPQTQNLDLSSVLLHEVKLLKAPQPKNISDPHSPTQIYIQESSAASPLANRARALCPKIAPAYFKNLKALFHEEGKKWNDSGKSRWIFSGEPYDFLERCPCTKQALCCNYYVLKLGMGCPYDCSYCYLQEYQNLRAILLPTNPEKFLEELSSEFAKNPGRFLRLGTGEYIDSLALDPITEYSKIFVPFFKDKNVLFELKTKSDRVENLLPLDHGGKTVVAWSVNPERIAAAEEWGAAVMPARLAAARRCQDAGYPVALHFDPILDYPGWEKDYRDLIEQIYSTLRPPLQWISLGTLRFAPRLKPVAEHNHPESRIFLGELFVDPLDRKMRYPAPRRLQIYQTLLPEIRRRDPAVPVYLCMEPPALWSQLFGGSLPFSSRLDSWLCQHG